MIRKVIELFKAIPIDFGQYEVRHTTKGKLILLELAGDGRGKRALDLGARDQFWSEKLAALGYDVTSVDLQPLNASVQRVDANEPLPFADQSFDLVWFTEVIEHLNDPSRTLAEVERVLKPGGNLLLSTPNSEFWFYRMFRALGFGPAAVQSEDHRQYFSYKDIQQLLGDCRLFGYFPYLFYKRTITRGYSALSPTIIASYHHPAARNGKKS